MNAGSVVIDFTLNTNTLEDQINDTIAEINHLVKELEEMRKQPGFDEQSEEAIALKQKIQEATNKLIGLRSEYNKLSKDSGKTFKGILNNLKKVGLRMLGIASVYGIISKASRSYLSQNEETSKKLKDVWIALGEIMAPIMDFLANELLKLIGYLNEFTKVFGLDFIANANARAIKNQAKAQKDLNKANKQSYDFDVIRKQQTNTSNSSSTANQIEIPELNQDIVKKLQDLAYWLKENWDWIKKVGIVLGVVFGAVAIGTILANIGTLIGSGTLMTGLAGLAALIALIGTAIIITCVVYGLEQLQSLNTELEKNIELNKGTQEQIEKTGDVQQEAIEKGKDVAKATKQFTDKLKENSDAAKKNANQIQETRNKLAIFGIGSIELKNAQESELETIRKVNEEFERMYEQGQLNDEQVEQYASSLQNEIEVSKKLGKSTDELREKLNKLSVKTYTAEAVVKVTADDSSAKKTVSSLGTLIGNLFGDIFGKNKTKAYAAGGIVTQPTRALIGEAGYPEAVVPMTDDYLGTLAKLIGQYSGGSGNGSVNVYLDGRLIQRQVNDKQDQYNFATNK